MLNSEAVFWAVLASFLVFDNLVLLPAGRDCISVRRDGRFRYDPALRLQARGRDVVFLNPLDTFQRVVVSSQVGGMLAPRAFRAGRRLVRDLLPAVNLLSTLGAVYLALLSAMAVSSLVLYFGDVLIGLACAHLSFWICALVLLVRRRPALHLSGYQTAALAAESLFVPGYLVNLGKRVMLRQQLAVPALAIGLRQLAGMPDDPARELYHLQMARRLDEYSAESGFDDVPPDSPDLRTWLEQARRCLAPEPLAP
jgi:hypothetical protein